ncbi:MAG: bifunctional DNA-formamidopyrimidine glycosylase/DNA-(apurinic or apyrimidinic site) lyase [bacterium]|nr:bifunctional DNA-formamidopyrimidine glycosylase/DNA-(apurinic or apyrimidinic site) lyase [bacterium]
MPELPEAQTIATQLDRCLRGVRLGQVTVRLRKIVRCNGTTLRAALADRRVQCVTRRGKRVVFQLEPDAWLVFRLGMTGQILVTESDTPRDRHVHLRISLDDDRRELRFRDVRRFGSVWFTNGNNGAPCSAMNAPPPPRAPASRAPAFRLGTPTTDNKPPTATPAGIHDLGPEPLELTPVDFDKLLSRRRQIKALLLDQHAIAGLGNIYCDEALFAARIHPLTQAADIPPPRRRALRSAIRRILRQAIRLGGPTLRDYRTATGQEGNFQTRHQVYGRQDQPCPRCKTPIQRIQAAGRSTHLCPACQTLSP